MLASPEEMRQAAGLPPTQTDNLSLSTISMSVNRLKRMRADNLSIRNASALDV
jgi:hypothetical protein